VRERVRWRGSLPRRARPPSSSDLEEVTLNSALSCAPIGPPPLHPLSSVARVIHLGLAYSPSGQWLPARPCSPPSVGTRRWAPGAPTTNTRSWSREARGCRGRCSLGGRGYVDCREVFGGRERGASGRGWSMRRGSWDGGKTDRTRWAFYIGGDSVNIFHWYIRVI